MQTISENEIIERTINIVNELYQNNNPKIDENILVSNGFTTDIVITLVENENASYTCISLKQNVPNSNAITGGYLSLSAIKELVDFILNNCPMLTNITLDKYSLNLSFMEYIDDDKNLLVNRLGLEINITDIKLQKMIKEYLLFFVNTYYKELSQTPLWEKNFSEYVNSCKKELLSEMNYNELLNITEYLNEDELRELFAYLSNKRFVEVLGQKIEQEPKLFRRKGSIS